MHPEFLRFLALERQADHLAAAAAHRRAKATRPIRTRSSPSPDRTGARMGRR